MAGCRHTAAFQRPWRRAGNRFRLCPDGAPVAARYAGRGRGDNLRDGAVRPLGLGRCRPNSGDGNGPGSSTAAVSFSFELWIGDRDGRQTRLDVPPERHLAAGRRRLADIDAANRMDRRWQDLCSRHSCRHSLVFLRRGRPRLRGSVRAGGTKSDTRLLLERRTPDPVDPRQPHAGVPEVLTPSDDSWSHTVLPGLPKIGRRQRLAPRPGEHRGRRRIAGQCPGSDHTALPVADRTGEGRRICCAARRKHSMRPGSRSASTRRFSEDGTRIPYVQVGPADTGGDAPIHLTGYGGFQISQLPHYNSAVGKLWLERGGTGVVAQIRGGGEFGPTWHEAGRRERKQLSHDDFAAVAADLVRRGVTRPQRIAAEGGSNGRPADRQHADALSRPFWRVVLHHSAGRTCAAIPNCSRAPAGSTNTAIRTSLRTGTSCSTFRPITPLMRTGPTRRSCWRPPGATTGCIRATPAKWRAKLQAMGCEAWFYEPAAGGHGYGKDNAERAAFTALGFRFLREAIGWNDGS